MKLGELRGKFRGGTAWIVGKGPSLAHLRREHFGAGPVIALNQAIAVLEALGLANPVYALQKDGCGLTEPHEQCALRDGHDWMLRPEQAVLIVQTTPGYSKFCLSNYEPRLEIDPVRDLGFHYPQTMAVRMGIALARLMGCGRVMMMCWKASL